MLSFHYDPTQYRHQIPSERATSPGMTEAGPLVSLSSPTDQGYSFLKTLLCESNGM